MKKWTDFIFDIGYRQVELFEQSNLTYMELMVNGTSFKSLLTSCYNILLKTGKLTEIENIPVTEKQRLFEVVKEFDTVKLDKEGYRIACRSLYTIEYFITTRP